MENVNPVPQPQNIPPAPEAGRGLAWFLSGAVLPLGSLAFYRTAAHRRVGSAVLFFLVFTLVITALSVTNLGLSLFSFTAEIQKAYAAGQIPDITITHGIAQVDGQQPLILFDQSDSSGRRTLVAVDTTGVMTGIDRQVYNQGFLLTRTELILLNQQGQYERLPLSELHSFFNQDPLLINAQTTSQAWRIVAGILVGVIFLLYALWFCVVRLMIVAMIALILWGLVCIFRPNTQFGPVLNIGLYAIVPAIYFSHLFSRSDISLPGIQTVLLLVFWIIGLAAGLIETPFFSQARPLRLWTAWIGLPLLLLLIVDMFKPFPSPAGPLILWFAALLTVLALVAVRGFLRVRDQSPESPAT